MPTTRLNSQASVLIGRDCSMPTTRLNSQVSVLIGGDCGMPTSRLYSQTPVLTGRDCSGEEAVGSLWTTCSAMQSSCRESEFSLE